MTDVSDKTLGILVGLSLMISLIGIFSTSPTNLALITGFGITNSNGSLNTGLLLTVLLPIAILAVILIKISKKIK